MVASTLCATTHDVFGLDGDGWLTIWVLMVPKGLSTWMLWRFSDTAGSATTRTWVACIPTPANAMVAATFRFWGYLCAAVAASPSYRTTGSDKISGLWPSAVSSACQAATGLRDSYVTRAPSICRTAAR